MTPGVPTAQVMTAADIGRAVRRIAHEIVERHHGVEGVVLVGIHTGGVPLAEAIAAAAGEVESVEVPVGELDIGLYRDDRRQRPARRLARTHIPVAVTAARVVLVDDVLYTGRTIRAALDALSDLGRPAAIELAALVDRGHRQLPIRADYVGKNLPTSPAQRVTVRPAGPEGEAGVWVEEP